MKKIISFLLILLLLGCDFKTKSSSEQELLGAQNKQYVELYIDGKQYQAEAYDWSATYFTENKNLILVAYFNQGTIQFGFSKPLAELAAGEYSIAAPTDTAPELEFASLSILRNDSLDSVGAYDLPQLDVLPLQLIIAAVEEVELPSGYAADAKIKQIQGSFNGSLISMPDNTELSSAADVAISRVAVEGKFKLMADLAKRPLSIDVGLTAD